MTQRTQDAGGLLTAQEEPVIFRPTHPGQFARVHTLDHIDCPACDAARTDRVRTIEQDMALEQASALWLDMRTAEPIHNGITARHIRSTTEVSYSQYVKSLDLFFGKLPLNRIHPGHLREFQRARLTGMEPFIRRRRPHEEPRPLTVKPKKVNQELATLRQIMQCAEAWSRELEISYKPLLEEEEDMEGDGPQRALQPEEQELWLYTAAQNERWRVVHWYSILSIGATLGTNEMRYLRLGDLNPFHRTVSVGGEGAKCKARRRTIALLTAEELWAAEQLLNRARTECGCTAPQHYVLPIRNRRHAWDPTRPMSTSGIKREWQEVRESSGLLWFRQYDLRHTGATRNAENNMPEAVRDRRMGHRPGSKMREHYAHIDAAAQRRAYEQMAAKKFAPQSVPIYGGRVPQRYA